MRDDSLPFPTEGTTTGPLNFGDPIYKACDCCGEALTIVPLLSGNTLGGILWSDGYLEAPYLPEQPLLGKCRNCGSIVCLVDLPLYPGSEAPNAAEDCSFLPLTLDDYERLLGQLDDVSELYQVYVRIKFWQLSNNARRYGDRDLPLTRLERENLLSLLESLGDAESDRLMKVEICRQLGEFAQAERILSEPFTEDVGPIVMKLLQLSRALDPRVAKILSSEPPDQLEEA